MNFFKMECLHDPKVLKKKGTLAGTPCEILVCSECKNDPDLQKFEEVLA